ncbi:hypothetical protein EST38_g12018, partial [Candolleomyces aberdarensis]
PAPPSTTAPPLKPWQEHLRRRAETREKYLERETDAERQSRESREQNAFKSYGKKSTYYIWEESDNGVRERKKVNKREVDEVMENYGTHQRRYDSVYDEWDLCSEFGDWTGEDQERWEEDELFLQPLSSFGQPTKDPSPPAAELPPPATEKPSAYVLPEVAIDDSPLSPPPEDDVFFGWQYPAELPGRMPKMVVSLFGLKFDDPNFEEICPPLENFANKLLYRAFGGHKQPETLEDKPINRLLCAVFQRCQHESELHRLDELCSCDLAPLCPTLRRSISKLVTVVDGVYVISPTTLRSPPPRIVVYTPEAAVFVCRLEDSDYETIVLALYRHGIRFNACYESPEQPSKSSNDYVVPILPAIYRKGTKSDPGVYQDYVRIRKFLLVGHRRRAALLMGGLLSRLAAEVIGSERECERLVQQDPSPTVLFSSWNAIVQLPNGHWLCDDVLLPIEKDCLLGTPFIAAPRSDEPRFRNNYEVWGWWPRCTVLESKNLNAYPWFWDDNNEFFYQNRTELLASSDNFPEAKRVKNWWGVSKAAEPLRRFQANFGLLCKNAIDKSLA